MTRDLRSETDIDELARQFVERTLPKPEWTHAAHFAVALWMLKRRGANAATELPALIRSYNEATGVANTATSGYHETITLASLRAANRAGFGISDSGIRWISAYRQHNRRYGIHEEAKT